MAKFSIQITSRCKSHLCASKVSKYPFILHITDVYAYRLQMAIHTQVKASSSINKYKQTVNDERSFMQIK